MSEPFDPDLAVITTKRVMHCQANVCRVIHDDEGEWIFFDEGELNVESSAIISLQEIIDIDPSLQSIILSLPQNKQAFRLNKNCQWEIYDFTYEE
ncbi:MAG: hypothetical protein IJS20_12845 [Bacteroidales bacterium]|nr:hypothetical protein [Bacteroidales bacterium]